MKSLKRILNFIKGRSRDCEELGSGGGGSDERREPGVTREEIFKKDRRGDPRPRTSDPFFSESN
jgi:hypothetical protein